MTIFILHTFSISSAPSMIDFFKTLIDCLIDLLDDTGSYSRAANSYPPAYPGGHGLCPQVLSSDTIDLICSNPSDYG